MKLSQRIGLLLFLFAQLALCGFAQYGIITTYAGPPLPVNGAQATTQAIDYPAAVAADGAGGFYVSSKTQNRIYRVAVDGSISLTAGVGSSGYSGDGDLATAAQLNHPTGVAVDSAGNLYISDTRNYRIRKVTTAGIISTVAGNGNRGYSGDGGMATEAQINYPEGVAVDSAGNLYIADYYDDRVRKVTTAGIISTVAGNGTSGFSGDGWWATEAQLYHPTGVAVDSAGNLYIADRTNERIRKVTTAGIIRTVAGNGNWRFSGDGWWATEAQLSPCGIAVDSAGNLYIADCANERVRKVTTAGIISTVAGNGTEGFSGDGGMATEAQINYPEGVAVDSAGNFYVADCANERIRKVTTGGIISTVAGKGLSGFSGDGGLATEAQLSDPRGIVVDSAGNLYIADGTNERIRKVTTGGIISTVAGNGTSGYSGDGGTATDTYLNGPRGVAVDSAGNLYIADQRNIRIRKVTRRGIISTVAGNGTSGYSGDGGPATEAQLKGPTGVAVDSAGNLYIADFNDNRIRKVTTAGIISTAAGNGDAGYGGDGGLATEAQLKGPGDVAVDSAGNLYIADYYSHRIRKVTTAGIISTVAGNGRSGFSGDGGAAIAAQIYYPNGVAVDSAGNFYVADTFNYRIRKVTAAGIISTVVGNGTESFSGDGGLATEAQIGFPSGVAVDSAGSFYIADTFNYRIRKVADAILPTVTTAAISSITQTAASGGGNVTSDGGASVTARGICWSLSADPTAANTCTSNGTGAGVFTSSITGLAASTIYHVRAYATNFVGTAYGADVAFNTLGPPNFQVSTGSGGSYSAVATAGSSAVYKLAVTGINGFSGSVVFTYSGLPKAANCSISPVPLSVSGSSAVPFAATITTTARTTTAGIIKDLIRFPVGGAAPAIIICLGSLTMMICMSRRRRISIVFLLLSAVGFAACGGRKTTQGTPAGTYSVVLTATSGSISHETNLTLTVK